MQRIVDLDADAELKIYPDALISGVVTGRDGLPLANIPVTLRRAIYDQTGLRWAPVRSVQTSLEGEYRFLEPSGRFQVSSSYVAHKEDTGEVILPDAYPQISGRDGANYLELKSGQSRRVDLQPRTGPAYKVSVQVDAADTQRGLQFYATTSSGESFQVPATGPPSGSSYQLSLPAGTYTLHGRLESRDTSLEGSAKLTVTGPKTEPTVLHLESALSVPVELSVDPASVTAGLPADRLNQVPDIRQLNLRLHATASADLSRNQDILVRQREDKSYEFRAQAGTYRLSAYGGGAWFIESASYGVVNLASNDITLSSSGTGIPIRVVVSNAYGTISATLKTSGTANTMWVYLIPETPSLTPMNPMGVASGTPGTTTNLNMRAPAGSYVVVALDHQIQDDLRNPEILGRFSTNARHVEVVASNTVSVAIEVATEKEPGR